MPLTARAAAGALALALSAAPAARGADPAPADGLTPVMLVLDGSGSMAEPAGPGVTRIAAARVAVRDVLARTPDAARVGLVLYGTGSGRVATDRALGCADVTLAHPVGPVDRAELGRAVARVTPRGFTPIGHALELAARNLPGPGPRAVVLVSDGEETCAPPGPCEVAERLHQEDPDLRIHSVGFQVRGKARADLVCIAQATGGTYADASDAAHLGPALSRTTGGALRNYRPAGVRVVGTTDPDRAPVLAQGAYVDTLGADARQYYSVDLAATETLYLGATTVHSRSRQGYQVLHARLRGPGGADCRTADDAVSSREGDGEPLTVALTRDPAATEAGGPAPECRGAGRYTLQIWRNADAGEPVPLELELRAEPAATAPGLAPAATAVPFTEPPATVTQVTGGGSFAAAATLAGTGAFTDVLQRGEVVFYRVALGWGQALAARVRFDSADRAVVNVTATLYSPYRARIATAAANYVGRPLTLPEAGSFATLPVRYGNRTLPAAAARVQAVPGWYYLGVKLGREDRADAPGSVPLRVEVAVVGPAEPGPTYGPSAATATPEPRLAANDRDPGGGFWWMVAGVAAAVLVGAAAAGVARLRRRPSTGR